MVQTSVNTDFSLGYEGRDVYPLLPREVVSKGMGEAYRLDFGRVCLLDSDSNYMRLPYSNQADLTLDADLVTSNTIAGNVVVNGSTTAVSVTFATDHATTMAALASAIAAVTGVNSATVTGAGSRQITVVADDDVDVYLDSFAVTGGVSQAGVTLDNTESGEFFGVSMFTQLEPDANGESYYGPGDSVNVGRDIYVDVRSEDALNPGDQVFVRFLEPLGATTVQKRGMLTSAAGSGPVDSKLFTGAQVVKSCSAGEICTIRVRV